MNHNPIKNPSVKDELGMMHSDDETIYLEFSICTIKVFEEGRSTPSYQHSAMSDREAVEVCRILKRQGLTPHVHDAATGQYLNWRCL